MAALPRRRERPIAHLDAHIVLLERALLARAEAIEAESGASPDGPDGELLQALMGAVAVEFRKLSDELHYW